MSSRSTLMEMIDYQIEESVTYADPDFPLARFIDRFDYFLGNQFDCHWHDELEVSIILTGTAEYLLNQTPYVVHAGEGIMIASRTLHSAKQLEPGTVGFNIVFPANILTQLFKGKAAYKYSLPASRWTGWGYPLKESNPDEAGMLSAMRLMYETSPDDFEYELVYTASLIKLWKHMLALFRDRESTPFEPLYRVREERMKSMIQYIQSNYMNHVTAQSIAAAANVSRSECFRCFTLFGEGSPIDYLNKYRLLIAAQKLLNTSDSIADISYACGFSSTSYFGKTFKESYNMSPLSFRKHGGVTE